MPKTLPYSVDMNPVDPEPTEESVDRGAPLPLIHSCREAWLIAAAEEFRAWFTSLGHDYPERLRISCGLAGGRIGSKAIGECWSPEASTDQAREIFISPTLDHPTRVLDVLLHELCHAVLPHEVKHGSRFKELAYALGLIGPATATIAGPELEQKLVLLVGDLGAYPHSAMDPGMRKKQTTRLVKVECPECGYTLRTTRKWIEIGLPTCCCGEVMTFEDPDAEEPDDEE